MVVANALDFLCTYDFFLRERTNTFLDVVSAIFATMSDYSFISPSLYAEFGVVDGQTPFHAFIFRSFVTCAFSKYTRT